jgi:Rrf2 family protein|tara:strand:- start:199 stop:603 length:405 start_codon:yes stop_codon:yes gene_type:complete
MLKINKSIEYALIAIKHIKSNNSNKLFSSRDISDLYNIPYELLSKILQRLCKLGYLQSVKGPNGGYLLKKSLNKISLIKFIEEFEGPVSFSQCTIDTNTECSQFDLCNIKSPINEINNNIRELLSNMYLNEITK